MKKALSLRKKIMIWMSLVVVAQNFFLVGALLLSKVFDLIEKESFRLFQNATTNRMQILEREMRQVGAIVSAEAETLSAELGSSSDPAESRPALSPDIEYEKIALLATPHLMHLLSKANVSGAFFTLTPTPEEKLPAVYIRNTTVSRERTRPENCLMELGPIEVSREYEIPTSANWDLSLPFSEEKENDEKTAFYRLPEKAFSEDPQGDFEHFGYWSSPVDLLSDGEPVVSYSLPLHDKRGKVYGILGVEISLQYFIRYYLHDMELPYENSFYAIAPIEKNKLLSKGLIPSTSLAQAYLERQEQLVLKPEKESIYSTSLEGLGDAYAFVKELTIYKPNSPFESQKWNLIGFAPKAMLYEGTHGIRRMMIWSFAVASLFSVFAIFMIAYVATRNITGLSTYVRGLSSNHEISFRKTGLQEIDDLTLALDLLNKRAMDASQTLSKILELSLLPIGGYEIRHNLDQVVLIGYLLELFGLDEGTILRTQDWSPLYEKLRRDPLANYEDVYRFEDGQGEERWLRIVETDTREGILGVVLDVSRDVRERMRLASELDHDPLTRLYNRTAFKREAELTISKEPSKIGAMLFIDLDNLKYINDNFGHETGDDLIARAAEMFCEFEKIGALLSRVSGDEFSIYLHGFDSQDQVRLLVEERLALCMGYTFVMPDGSRQPIRFSAGLAWYPQDADSVARLLRFSDFAMYEAKNRDKGRMFEFDLQSYEHNSYLLDNREAISRLIDEERIHFHFQPIVDLRTGEVYAYEALMRSSMPEFRTPMEILRVASAQSKLGQLERLVFFTALRTVKEQQKLLGEKFIFINSIPEYLLGGASFKLLQQEYGELFSRLVLEVTEMESDRLRHLEDRLKPFREEGIRLAIDDFGSGYSNELRILQVKPHIVKIDMGLTQGVHKDPDKQQLIENLVSFCHERSVLIVGEGIEEKEDLKKLIELDVDLVQGYHTARPASSLQSLRPEIKEEILRLREEKEQETRRKRIEED